MARWYFPDPKKYAVLGDYWYTHYNDTPDKDLEEAVRQLIIDNDGRDQDGTKIDDKDYDIKIVNDKDKDRCQIFRPDTIPNLSYLKPIVDEIKGQMDPLINQKTLLGVYLITKCR